MDTPSREQRSRWLYAAMRSVASQSTLGGPLVNNNGRTMSLATVFLPQFLHRSFPFCLSGSLCLCPSLCRSISVAVSVSLARAILHGLDKKSRRPINNDLGDIDSARLSGLGRDRGREEGAQGR